MLQSISLYHMYPIFNLVRRSEVAAYCSFTLDLQWALITCCVLWISLGCPPCCSWTDEQCCVEVKKSNLIKTPDQLFYANASARNPPLQWQCNSAVPYYHMVNYYALKWFESLIEWDHKDKSSMFEIIMMVLTYMHWSGNPLQAGLLSERLAVQSCTAFLSEDSGDSISKFKSALFSYIPRGDAFPASYDLIMVNNRRSIKKIPVRGNKKHWANETL